MTARIPSISRRQIATEALESRSLLSTAYYISPSGSDLNSGLTPETAWQTVSRVNNTTFAAGDSINFQGGAVFGGPMGFDANDVGTAAAPITLTSYGDGRAVLQGTATAPALSIFNTGGFNVSNLNFVGAGPTVSSRAGISVMNRLDGDITLEHIYIDDVDVSGFGTYGINVQASNGNSGFSDVRITDSKLHDNLLGGIITYGPWGEDKTNYAKTLRNVYVGNVEIYSNCGNPGATETTGNGIVLGGVDGGVVERSVVRDNGDLGGWTAGIWCFNSNNVTFQHNESYRNRTANAYDGDGFDFDWNTTNSLMQYNYSHDNDGAGYLLWNITGRPASSGNVVRYNISENDGRRNKDAGIHVGGPVDNTEIYNNTVYVTPSSTGSPAAAKVADWTGTGLHFRNNIFQTTGGVPLADVVVGNKKDFVFQGNDYWSTGGAFQIRYNNRTYKNLASFQAAGQEKLNGKSVGSSADPLLTRPGQGGTIGNAELLYTLTAYQLRSDSPLRNSGLNLLSLFGINTGEEDFYGNATPLGAGYSMGAHELA